MVLALNWWDSQRERSFVNQYAKLQNWRGVAYRNAMLNALRINSEALPLSEEEWILLLQENKKWNHESGNWDDDVTLKTGVVYLSPELEIASSPGQSPPLIMETQQDAVLCSIHSLNNLLQARIANPAMFENMENAFLEDGSLQQCDSEHVVRVARMIGVSLVGVDIIQFGFGGGSSINELESLRGDVMLERFLKSTGGFMILRQGRVGVGNAVGGGHYVAVLYGGQGNSYFSKKWILMNSLANDVTLYDTAWHAIQDYQLGMTVNVSIFFPTIPTLESNGDVVHGTTPLSDAHFRLLRLQLLNRTNITVDAWKAMLTPQQAISIAKLNSAYTHIQFPVLRSTQRLLSQDPNRINNSVDVETVRTDWRGAYEDVILSLLGTTNVTSFRKFMFMMLMANAATNDSKQLYIQLARDRGTQEWNIYWKLWSLSFSLFSNHGNLSEMPEEDRKQLKMALQISLSIKIMAILNNFSQPDIGSDDIINELFRVLTTNRASASYFKFITSMGISLSLFVPQWMVIHGHGAYGMEPELLVPLVPEQLLNIQERKLESLTSQKQVATATRNFYIVQSKIVPDESRETRLRKLIQYLILTLINNKSAVVDSTATNNVLSRPENYRIQGASLDVSQVPSALPFYRLLSTTDSGLNSFPV